MKERKLQKITKLQQHPNHSILSVYFPFQTWFFFLSLYLLAVTAILFFFSMEFFLQHRLLSIFCLPFVEWELTHHFKKLWNIMIFLLYYIFLNRLIFSLSLSPYIYLPLNDLKVKTIKMAAVTIEITTSIIIIKH